MHHAAKCCDVAPCAERVIPRLYGIAKPLLTLNKQEVGQRRLDKYLLHLVASRCISLHLVASRCNLLASGRSCQSFSFRLLQKASKCRLGLVSCEAYDFFSKARQVIRVKVYYGTVMSTETSRTTAKKLG